MDIYQFAMQMEKDGENYYRKLAAECGVPGLQKIFTMLADEEVNTTRSSSNSATKKENPASRNSLCLKTLPISSSR